jgi:hypothetical protein
VANHAKFATAHLFQPQPTGDFFVSMMSRHVDRGRRNLGANTIHLMRRLGMSAVQTVLFPQFEGSEIQRLNHMMADELRNADLDVRPEIERAFAVTTPHGATEGHRIFLAGEVVDVLLNAQAWNQAVATPAGRELWGRRRVQYFVYVPYSSQFAPCKFCAYLPVQRVASSPSTDSLRMTLELYTELDESETRFDGHTAQRHLTQRLGMLTRGPSQDQSLAELFQRWLNSMAGLITVHSRGPIFLCPPDA